MRFVIRNRNRAAAETQPCGASGGDSADDAEVEVDASPAAEEAFKTMRCLRVRCTLNFSFRPSFILYFADGRRAKRACRRLLRSR